jgi:hypothetical protein
MRISAVLIDIDGVLTVSWQPLRTSKTTSQVVPRKRLCVERAPAVVVAGYRPVPFAGIAAGAAARRR